MTKFLDWCNRNHKPIGYTVGGLNVLAGLNSLVYGNYGLAIVGFTIGGSLIFDAYREFK